jgi:hypothetical protein
MSKPFLFIVLIIVFSLKVNGQNTKFLNLSKDNQYLWAEIEFNDGSKEQGLIRDRNEYSRYSRIVFYDSMAKKSTYKPADISAYRLKSGRFKSDSKSKKFYELEGRGYKVSLYKFRYPPTTTSQYSLERSGSGVKVSDTSAYEDLGTFYFFYNKERKEFFRIPQEGDFHKEVAVFFKDCPELSKRIIDKEFKENELSAIMDVYNFMCHL